MLADELQISKNTCVSDIHEVKSFLNENFLKLQYSNDVAITGKEFDIRNIFIILFVIKTYKWVKIVKIIQGIAASNGIAIGKVTFLKKDNEDICKRNINNVKREISRLETAKAAAVKKLNEIYLKSLKVVGEEDSNIFQIYIMMIQDQDYIGEIKQMISNEQINAEYAVWSVGKRFAEKFARMDSEYMQARSVDVIDISKRLIKGFEKKKEDVLVPQLQGQYILAADDLTPGELVQIEKENVLAIITQKGSRTSHLAIFSRTMGIPAVVGLAEEFQKLKDGKSVIVDGLKGEVIVQAGDKVLKYYYDTRKGLLNITVICKN